LLKQDEKLGRFTNEKLGRFTITALVEYGSRCLY